MHGKEKESKFDEEKEVGKETESKSDEEKEDVVKDERRLMACLNCVAQNPNPRR